MTIVLSAVSAEAAGRTGSECLCFGQGGVSGAAEAGVKKPSCRQAASNTQVGRC